MNLGVLLVLVAILVVALMALGWWLATHVKRGLEGNGDARHEVHGLDVSSACVAALRKLSSQPILLKQGEDGLRVQIDDRPMLVIAALRNQESEAALREVAVATAGVCGAEWVVVARADGDTHVTITRLA